MGASFSVVADKRQNAREDNEVFHLTSWQVKVNCRGDAGVYPGLTNMSR